MSDAPQASRQVQIIRPQDIDPAKPIQVAAPLNPANLGIALKALREVAGLDQDALTHTLVKTQSMISKYEAGKSRITLLDLETYAKRCGYSVELVFVPKAKGDGEGNGEG